MCSVIAMLYQYAQENQVFRYLQTPEYRRAVCGLEDGWDAFRSTLAMDQRQCLDALLARETEAKRSEEEAVFSSGISIGLDLGRL